MSENRLVPGFASGYALADLEGIKKPLSAKEERAILMQFARSRGKKGFTNEECAALLSEAAAIRLKNDMLSMVIAGLLVCDWNGNAMTLPSNYRDQARLY